MEYGSVFVRSDEVLRHYVFELVTSKRIYLLCGSRQFDRYTDEIFGNSSPPVVTCLVCISRKP